MCYASCLLVEIAGGWCNAFSERASTPVTSNWHKLIPPELPSVRWRMMYRATVSHVIVKAGACPAVQAEGEAPDAHTGFPVFERADVATPRGRETLPARIWNARSLFWQQSTRFQIVTVKMRATRPRSTVIHGHVSPVS